MNEFDRHMTMADKVIEQCMGDPVLLSAGKVQVSVQAVVSDGSHIERMRQPRLQRLQTFTKAVELRASLLPCAVDSLVTLAVEFGGVVYRVIDHDLDDGWILLALVPEKTAPKNHTSHSFVSA